MELLVAFVNNEILIECRGCGVENVFNDYAPDMFLVCNQCRERLVEPDFCEIYRQFNCQDCGFTVFVKSGSDFQIGESVCKCEGTNFKQGDPKAFLKAVENSAGFEPMDDLDDDGAGWYRSEPIEDDTYEDLFTDNPSDN